MRRIKPIGHEDQLPVVDHLDELRSRLMVASAAFLVAFGLTTWQSDLVLEILNAPLPGGLRADHARPRRAVHHHAQELGLRRPAAVAAGPALPGLRLPRAGLQPARAQVVRAAAADGAGAVHRRGRLLLPRRAAAGARLPAQLQRLGVQHPAAGERLLRLRDADHARHGPRLPGPGRRARADPPRRGDRRQAAPQPPLRDPGDRGARRAAAHARPGHAGARDGAAAGSSTSSASSSRASSHRRVHADARPFASVP